MLIGIPGCFFEKSCWMIRIYLPVLAERQEKARTCLSREFLAGTDDIALKEFLSESAIVHYRETRWSIARQAANMANSLVPSPLKVTA
jgi:hypothetical protein